MKEIALLILWLTAWVAVGHILDEKRNFFYRQQYIVMAIGAVFGMVSLLIWR